MWEQLFDGCLWSAIPSRVPEGDVARAPLTDTELLVRCRAGQEEAWDMLVGRYERLVYSIAVRNGLTHEDAVDVAQNTFGALLESIDTVRDDERLAWWLMTVARRQSWRIRDRRRHEVPYAQLDLAPTDPLVDWERAASLHQALNGLGNPCRNLLIALYFEPDSPPYSEVARRFGRSIGSIGPMRGRCLARLRAMLVKEGWA